MNKEIPKFFFTDTETNGLDPKVQSPWQIAGIIRSKVFKFEKEINTMMCPFLPEASSPKALEMGHYKGEQLTIKHFDEMQSSAKAFTEINNFLSESCDPMNTNDKMIIVGYNVGFDKDMLYHFWKRNNNNYFFSYFKKYIIDVYAFVQPLWMLGVIESKNCQLAEVCKFYNIEIDAHDALSDIRATMKLFDLIVAPYLRSFFKKVDPNNA